MSVILRLFSAFLKIGAFSFGGGYAVLSLMQKEIIESHGWISLGDFVNIVAVAEMTPGPIAVNAATFVGFKVASLAGAAVCTLGVILIPFLLSLTAAIYFNKFKHLKQINWILKGVKPAVLGLIASACIKIARASLTDYKSLIIGLAVFLGVYKLKLNPILAIVLSGGLGVLFYGVF